MRRVCWQFLLLVVFFFGLSSSAQAGRTVVAPPYLRRIIFDFPATLANGQRIAAIMSIQITLTNLSAIAQSGQMSLKGTSAGGSEVGRTNGVAFRMVSCGNAPAGADNQIPSAVPFSVGPNQTVTYQVVVLFKSTYGPAPSFTQFDAIFNPLVTFAIDQDRGAMMGTMVPTWDMAVQGYSLCDGTSTSNYAGPTGVSESRTGVPLLINGGRPF